MHDARHAVACGLAEDIGVNRDVSPAEELQALLLGDDLHHAHGERALQVVLRQEEHADAVVPLVSEGDAALCGSLLEEAVADLRQNADAVADLAGGILAGAVLELLHDVQCIIEDLIILVSVDVDDGTDAAGIVFLLQRFVHRLEIVFLLFELNVVHKQYPYFRALTGFWILYRIHWKMDIKIHFRYI